MLNSKGARGWAAGAVLTVSILAMGSGCIGEKTTLPAPGKPPGDTVSKGFTFDAPGTAPSGAYKGGIVENGGSITGTVTLHGERPASRTFKISRDTHACGKEIQSDSLIVSAGGKGVKNAIVSIVGIGAGKAARPHRSEAPGVLDQKGCMFTPHVLVVDVGSWVIYKNSSDPVSHNTNVVSKFGQGFNRLLPSGGASDPMQLNEAERLRVKCDIHPWMVAWVAVMDNPYWALTDGEGKFEIDNVPQGTYTLKFWHEKLKKHEMTVTVEAAKAATADVGLVLKRR